jgi:hypothetical protein
MKDMRNACKILVGEPEWKRPLGRPTCRWENSIKIDLRDLGLEREVTYNLIKSVCVKAYVHILQ